MITKRRETVEKKKATERATIAKATTKTKTAATPTTPPRDPKLWGDDSSAYSPSSFKASDTFLIRSPRWLGKADMADEDHRST